MNAPPASPATPRSGYPARIVSLLSSNTEMACALGLEDRLVGISHECDAPASILDLPRLTRSRIEDRQPSAGIDRQVRERWTNGEALYEIDEAGLLEARPDLILTQAQCQVCAVALNEVEAAVRRFPAERRPTVLSFQPESMQDVFEDMRRIAAAAGVEAAGRRTTEALRRRADHVRAVMARAVAIRGRPRVLALEWLDPPMPGGCWTPGLVRDAGGEALLARETEKARALEWREIAACGAETLILFPCGFNIERTLKEVGRLMARPEIRALPAAREGRIAIADGAALFIRPGPRLVDSLELLAHLIHPEAAARGAIPHPEAMAVTWDGVERRWREPAGPAVAAASAPEVRAR